MLLIVLLIGKDQSILRTAVLNKNSRIFILQFDGLGSYASFGKDEVNFVPALHGCGDYSGTPSELTWGNSLIK